MISESRLYPSHPAHRSGLAHLKRSVNEFCRDCWLMMQQLIFSRSSAGDHTVCSEKNRTVTVTQRHRKEPPNVGHQPLSPPVRVQVFVCVVAVEQFSPFPHKRQRCRWKFWTYFGSSFSKLWSESEKRTALFRTGLDFKFGGGFCANF